MQRPSPSRILAVGAAGRGLCHFFLGMVAVIAMGSVAHAQTTRDELPPLPAVSMQSHKSETGDAQRRRSSFDELQLLVPVTPLLCWSHSSAENPQGSRRNAEGNELAKDSAVPSGAAMDPIVGPVVHPRRDP